LVLLAGLLWSGLALNLQAQEIPADLDIIDCHIHFYDPNVPHGRGFQLPDSPLGPTILPKDLHAAPKFRPVTGTVVVEANPHLEGNAWLLELAKNDPFIVGIVGNLAPGEPGFAANLERFAKDPLFRGIRISVRKLNELLDQENLDDLRLLAKYGLALDVNGGPDTPAAIAKLAPRIPQLRIVLNHIGNVHVTDQPPPKDWQAGVRAAAEQPNVFCKISALVESAARDGKTPPTDLEFYRRYHDVVWNAFGEDRVIYASNWPVSEKGSDYQTLQKISLQYAAEQGEKALRKFCSKNSQRAYNWVERPGRKHP